MDVIRSLLIGAIAVLSFMLLTEWVNFKDERRPAAPVQQTITVADQDLPAAHTDLASDEEDIPVITDAASIQDPVEMPATSTASLINIKNDVLSLIIDLKGGDIIQSALPQYPAKIDTPEVPYLLLENSDRRSYTAQSGLVGTDGIDSKGRAAFTESKSTYSLGQNEDNLVVNLVNDTGTGVIVTKRFTMQRGDYLVRVDYLVNNQSPLRLKSSSGLFSGKAAERLCKEPGYSHQGNEDNQQKRWEYLPDKPFTGHRNHL